MTRWVALILTLASVAPALACRYTVRDIGFVDLHGPRITLALVTSGEATAHVDAAEAILVDCNVDVVVVDPAERDHPAVRAMPPGVGVAYVLVDDLGRTIQLDRAATPQAAREAVQRIAASPIRDAMRSAIVDAFAFSIVVEGVDGEQNAVAHAVAAELDAAIKRYEEHLPRAIAGEMQTLVIPRSAIADERLFLWALGIDEPLNLTAPQLLITYGRAKRAGDVLCGPTLTTADAVEQLALVGESCECDTDRDWVNEPSAPLHWGSAERSEIARVLGFDPESPMVKAEVVRVIARGQGKDARTLVGRGSDDAASLLYGYSETVIDDPVVEPAETSAPEPIDELASAESPGDWFGAPAAPAPDEPAPQREASPTSGGDSARLPRPVVAALFACVAASIASAVFVLLLRKARS